MSVLPVRSAEFRGVSRTFLLLFAAACVDGAPTALTPSNGAANARNPASLPDLALVGKLSTDRSDAFPGEQITLSIWSVHNSGRAVAVHWTASIVMARDTALSQGLVLNVTQDVPTALPAGLSPVEISAAAITLPSDIAPGTYFIGALLDGSGTVAEQDEANNYQSVRIHVAPDIDARNAVA